MFLCFVGCRGYSSTLTTFSGNAAVSLPHSVNRVLGGVRVPLRAFGLGSVQLKLISIGAGVIHLLRNHLQVITTNAGGDEAEMVDGRFLRDGADFQLPEEPVSQLGSSASTALTDDAVARRECISRPQPAVAKMRSAWRNRPVLIDVAVEPLTRVLWALGKATGSIGSLVASHTHAASSAGCWGGTLYAVHVSNYTPYREVA